MSVLTRGSQKGANQVIQMWLLQIISSLMIVNLSGLVKLYLKLWVHKRILTTGENCLQIERQSLFAFLSFKTVLHSFEKPTLWQPSDVQNHVIQGETKIVVTLNLLSVQEIEWQCSRSLTSLISTWRPCHNVSLFLDKHLFVSATNKTHLSDSGRGQHICFEIQDHKLDNTKLGNGRLWSLYKNYVILYFVKYNIQQWRLIIL